MNINSYRARLSQPITPQHPTGERISDDPLLDYIETQMVKVGSLSHEMVQWQEVERIAVELLESRTKDLKILSYLLQCLQHHATSSSFLVGLQILADFIQLYWNECFPAPGERGHLPRRKYFTQIMLRSEQALNKIDFSYCEPEHKQQLDQSLAQLTLVCQQANLPINLIVQIQEGIERKVVASAARLEPSHSASTTAPRTISSTSLPDMDNSNERSIKQTLLKVVDFLSEQENGYLIGLRLRRFAIWFAITSLPEANAQQETALLPVAADRLQEYQEALQNGADLNLWRRVEQSLTVSPFWLDGHYLSYQIALKLGESTWAEAILQELLHFLNRLPELLAYRFKGGKLFAATETQQWLHQANQPTQNQNMLSMSQSWQELRQQLFELAHQSGLSVALNLLNEQLTTQRETRDQFYLRLLSADLLDEFNLSALAKIEYQTLFNEVKAMDVTHWEPSLLERLGRMIQMEESRK